MKTENKCNRDVDGIRDKIEVRRDVAKLCPSVQEKRDIFGGREVRENERQ